MPRISKVGDGYVIPDYATRALWWAVESAVDYGGLPIIAELLGDCGDDYNLSGSSVNGAECYTKDVVYDGTNESELAVTSRCVISVSNLFVEHDLKYTTEHTSFYAFTLLSDSYQSARVRYFNSTSGTGCISINGYYPNSNIEFFIASGGVNGIYGGYNRGTNFSNGLIFNCQNGVNSNRTQMVLDSVFAFGNGTDYVNGSTRTDCASEDLTGDYTGYTSAELVDFAGGDLRTKSTSDLATLGSPFIGAFLESGGGGGVSGDIELSVDTVGFSASGNATLPQPNGAINFAINEVEFTCSASATLPNPSGEIDFDLLSIDFTGSGSATIPFPVGAASFDIALIEFNATGSSTQPSPSGGVEFGISSIEFIGSGGASLPFPVGSASFEVAQVEFSGTGQATSPQPSGNADFSVDEVGFYATGSATQPDSVGNIAFDITSIEFSAIGSVTGVTLPFGDVILPAYTSNVIILNTPPNLIKL